MIAPNSSLQDWHAFALDKEPWFVSLLVYNRNEDSINYVMLHKITHTNYIPSYCLKRQARRRVERKIFLNRCVG